MSVQTYQDDDPEVMAALRKRLSQPAATPAAPVGGPQGLQAAPETRPAEFTGDPSTFSPSAGRDPYTGANVGGLQVTPAPLAPTTTPPAVTPPPTPQTGPAPFAQPGNFNVNQLRDAWLSSGGRTPADLAAFIKTHPEFAAGVTISGSKSNKLYGPNGEFLADAIFATSDPSQARAAWDTGTGGGGGGATTVPAAASNPWLEQIRAILMDRLRQASQGVDPNDPSIAAPLQAARQEATRENERGRKAAAERLYAQGSLNTNELNQTVQQSSERTALGLAGLRAQLLQQIYADKRQELMETMQLAVASGDAASAREIQLQLSYLEAQLRREGFDVTRDGYRNQRDIASAQLNADTVKAVK